MGIKDIGRLLGADEGLNHQIVDTFATLSQADMAWTEKIWASLARIDGSLQVDFGLGKYQNRGIIDGFGGVSRGRQQWTVRGSRVLHSAPEEMAVGPIHMEVVEPLKQMRFLLEPNDVQPISFDIVLTGVTPPFFEDRNFTRNKRTGRVDVDVIRYHQGGWASGTIKVEVKGRTSHAGASPELGRNAVMELAHQMLQLSKLASAEKGTTINFTVVKGGDRKNIIPDYAEADADIRLDRAVPARHRQLAGYRTGGSAHFEIKL